MQRVKIVTWSGLLPRLSKSIRFSMSEMLKNEEVQKNNFKRWEKEGFTPVSKCSDKFYRNTAARGKESKTRKGGTLLYSVEERHLQIDYQTSSDLFETFFLIE